MSQQELLNRVVAALDASGVAYMVTGSTVSSLQGEPRATHDVDIVVALRAPPPPSLFAAFPEPDYYLDDVSAAEAVRHRTMFNLIQLTSGDKVDFWLLTDEPFDASRFARRELVEAAGVRMYVSRPEDTVLAKLRWAKLCGGSEKQMGDALGVYQVQLERLDQGYLRLWAARLCVVDLLERLERDARG